MAVLTIAAFISKWGATNFPSTGNRSITAAKMRDFRQDIADSFQSVLGATTITSWKSPCVVATTANISLTGEQTIDGVLTSASRVLVKNQTTTSQNGIYVTAAGAWSRSTDADSAGELEGAAVAVTQGTTLQNTIWSQTTDSITLGTSAIAWQQVGYATATNVLDEDDMASDSPTEPPSQQSVKAYVDASVEYSYTSTYPANLNLFSARAIPEAGSASTARSHTIYTVEDGPDNSTYYVEVVLVAMDEGGSTGGAIKIAGTFKKIAGVITQIGSTVTLMAAQEDISGSLTASFNIAGGGTLITVTSGTASVQCNTICSFEVVCVSNEVL